METYVLNESPGMNNEQTGAGSALFGDRGQTGVSRGLGEFRGRRPVLVTAPGEALLALPVEGLDGRRLAEFAALCAPVAPELIITERRAFALGLNARTPIAVPLSPSHNAAAVLALVTGAVGGRIAAASPASRSAAAAIQLAKMSHSLPAVLAADVASRAFPCDETIVQVDANEVARFADESARSLVVAGEASVPLSTGAPSRFIVFRDAMGDSQAAVIIGTPDFARPVPVRLHSACLTGDVFGSRRCDCGDQLRLALAKLEHLGGGIVLYMPQEGRGLGLANKMRTYQLQDEGLDTIDANTTLGFDDDERNYRIAGRMLRMLNCTRVVLLTNNPAKLDGLTAAGIDVTSRMQLEVPINPDTHRYMIAKAARSGHRLEYLTVSLADQS
jgi:GTP cyclohydrolase II